MTALWYCHNNGLWTTGLSRYEMAKRAGTEGVAEKKRRLILKIATAPRPTERL